jgi:hypothetical protein
MLGNKKAAEYGAGSGVSRRFVLRAGLVGACACLLPWPSFAATPGFYIENRDRFLADFKGVCAGAEKWIAPRASGPTAKAVADDAMRRFETLLPGLPDLGGRANRNQPFITLAGWLTALYLAMREKGMPARDAGRLYYDLYAAEWASTPEQKAHAMGAALFTPQYLAALTQWADASQKRLLPGDWVGQAVPGDGKTFDVGYDYTECGAVKYLKSQGAAEVAPYFCLNDFLASRAQGTGLSRKGTLAQGDPLCDFRYKRDRPVTQSWDTEAPRFDRKKPA